MADPQDTQQRALASDHHAPATIVLPGLTYFADGTRVIRRGHQPRRNTLGTTVGMTVGATPYEYQVVKWDDGTRTRTSPQVLVRVQTRGDAPASPDCRKIAGGACGHMTSRVWAVRWTTRGSKTRQIRYVHDVENRLTGERESTLYPEGADQRDALSPHFELTDSWRKAEKASA